MFVLHENTMGRKKGPRKRNKPANICPIPIALALNSLYVLLEISTTQILLVSGL